MGIGGVGVSPESKKYEPSTHDAFSKPLYTKWTHGVKLRPSFGEASASADFGGYALN